ncbi:hypothetical protein T439DRAFT_324245 [Meredithblackwellia eburnea MCA 4105]
MTTTLDITTLLSSQLESLTQIYSKLSTQQPNTLLQADLQLIHDNLKQSLDTKLTHAQTRLEQAQDAVTIKWKRVDDWREALGETSKGKRLSSTDEGRNQGPLDEQDTHVEKVLGGMRSRMKERGTAILELQKKIRNLSQVVGEDFLEVVLEQPQVGSGGGGGKEEEWEGLDLKLDRMSKLESEVLRCEMEISRRRTLISTHANEIFALRSELGIHSSSSSSETHTHDAFDEHILSHLGVGEGREHRELVPSKENLLRIEAKRTWLEEEKDRRNALIQTTYDKLYPLWTMLGVSDDQMEEFVNKWMGSTADVVNAYQTELSRMQKLKLLNLSSFIERERTLLTGLWDSLYLSPSQRLASFPAFAVSTEPSFQFNAVLGIEEEIVNPNVSEELLVAHEREREKVEMECERARPVLERLRKYFEVVEEMRELEASAADPSRLLGKSTRGDPGRLLREEKARKRVAKEKPKLETELRQLIPAWESENNRPFLLNGVRFLDSLDQQIEQELAEKENKKRSKTPAPSSRPAAAPLRAQKTGGTSSSASSSTSTVPIKRQMTGSASTTAKRQVPMHTGGASSTSSTPRVLGEIGNARTGIAKIATHVTGNGGGGSLLAKSTPGSAAGGMRIPAGWGGAAGSAMETPSASVHHGHGAMGSVGGGFRPRSSTQSSVSGTGSGWSSAGRVGY